MHIVILVHLLYPKRPLKDYIYWGDELTSVTIRTHIFDQSEAEKLSHTDTESTYCQALLYEQRLQKLPYLVQLSPGIQDFQPKFRAGGLG